MSFNRSRKIDHRTEREERVLAWQDGTVIRDFSRVSHSKFHSTPYSTSKQPFSNFQKTGEFNRDILIGLSDDQCPVFKLPGLSNGIGFSVGYKQNGQILESKKIMESGHALKEGDVIGCGVNYLEKRMFYTVARNLLLGWLIRPQTGKNPIEATVSDFWVRK